MSYFIDSADVADFEEHVLLDNWEKVVEYYKKDKFYHTLKIKNRGTALHVAVSNGMNKDVENLVEEIQNMWGDKEENHPLKMMNERDCTPLHIAAYRGFIRICQCIIGKNGERIDLIRIKNKVEEETPLFWAVLGNKPKTFVYLQKFVYDKYDVSILMDKNRTTILHVAIRREMFDLANIIHHCYEFIRNQKNNNNVTPLEELASRTSAFESGNHLSCWEQILFWCFPMKLQDAKTAWESLINGEKKGLFEVHCNNTCCSYIWTGPIAKLDGAKSGDKMILNEDKVLSTFDKMSKWPILSLLDGLDCTVKSYSKKILAVNLNNWTAESYNCFTQLQQEIQFHYLKKIEIIKKKRLYAAQLLKEFMKYPYDSYLGDGGIEAPFNTEHEEEIENIVKSKLKNEEIGKSQIMEEHNPKPVAKENNETKHDIGEIMQEIISKLPITSDKKDLLHDVMKDIEKKFLAEKNATENTTYLVAAKHGIKEITSQLESKIKSVIHERNSNDENVLLLAVKYRQPQIVEGLKKSLSIKKDDDVFESLCQQVDKKKNTMLHLAAYTSVNKETTWRISGPAMQMMWDVKWYKYIQRIVPEHFKHTTNSEDKTPGEIFKEEHENLLQKSTNWLKETAESGSVVAALIAGLSFATSGSVPGGNKDSGKPALEGQPAFEGFAISSLIGLYFSGLALIMFLSILTSRKQIEDFTINLPTKLLFGLTSLFVSIVAMFISFCAGHFFVLTDKYGKHDILFYLIIVFSFPVIFFGFMQLPLYIDLVKVIFKKVPPPSIKGVHL